MSGSSELNTDSVGNAASSDSHMLHIDLTGEVGKMANDLMRHLDKAMRGLIYKILVFHNSDNQMLEVWKNVEHRIAEKPSRRELDVVRFQKGSAVIECALGDRHSVRIFRLRVAYAAARRELRSRIGDVPCPPARTNLTVTAANGEALQPDMAVMLGFGLRKKLTMFCVEYAETEDYAHVLAKCMLLRHAAPEIASFVIVKASNLPGNPKLAAIDPDYSEDYQIWAPLDPGDTVEAGNHTTLEFNFDEDISIPPSGVERQRQSYELVHLSDRRRTYAYCAEPDIPVFRVRGQDNILVAPFAYCKTRTLPTEIVRETIYIDIEKLVEDMHWNREGSARAYWEEILERRTKGRGSKRGGKRGGSRVEKLPSRVPVRYIDVSKPRADLKYKRIEFSDNVQVLDEIFLLLGSAPTEQWVVPSVP